MGTSSPLEESLRRLAKLLSGPETKQWRKRVAKYADRVAAGNPSVASEILGMYQGGMGSFLDLQGSSHETHEQLKDLRDRVHSLATEMAAQAAKLGT